MTTCAEGGSFTIWDFDYNSSTEPDHECYYAVRDSSSAEGRFDFSPAYAWDGEPRDEGPYVYRLASSSTGTGGWAIGHWTAGGGLAAVCYSYDEDDEMPTHPTDVTSWECPEGINTDFLVTCDPGCDGVTPSPTTSDVISREEVDSSQSTSPIDTAEVWVGIVGGVIGTIAILVGLVRYFYKKSRPEP